MPGIVYMYPNWISHSCIQFSLQYRCGENCSYMQLEGFAAYYYETKVLLSSFLFVLYFSASPLLLSDDTLPTCFPFLNILLHPLVSKMIFFRETAIIQHNIERLDCCYRPFKIWLHPCSWVSQIIGNAGTLHLGWWTSSCLMCFPYFVQRITIYLCQLQLLHERFDFPVQ